MAKKKYKPMTKRDKETDPEGTERERRDPAGQETPEPQGLHREYPKQVE